MKPYTEEEEFVVPSNGVSAALRTSSRLFSAFDRRFIDAIAVPSFGASAPVHGASMTGECARVETVWCRAMKNFVREGHFRTCRDSLPKFDASIRR